MSGWLARRARLAAVLLAWLTVLGCRGMPWPFPPIHLNPNMDDQPRSDAQQASSFFYDGKVMQPPVPGTVARGELVVDKSLLTGRGADGEYLQASPLVLDEGLVERGQNRYTIYCQPCHDERGTGQGILAERASVPTATFHDPQRLAYSDGQIFEVITNGFGLMPSYRYPLSPADRWAIVAYVRRLQAERAPAQPTAVEPPPTESVPPEPPPAESSPAAAPDSVAP
jgi:mono/diheme cytochrome c family protein